MKLIAVLLLTLTFFACGGNTTPQGINVKGTVSGEEARVIDEATTKLFQDARRDGYNQWLEYGRYIVQVRDDCTSGESGTKSFLVDAPNYDGTYWDQVNTLGEETDPDMISRGFIYKKDGVGRVRAAEMIVKDRKGTPTGEFWICHDTPESMRLATRFGLEHIVLYYNDRDKYLRTETHTSAENSHPLIKE